MNLLCRIIGHKLEFAGQSVEGDVFQCVREREPMHANHPWPQKLIDQAYRDQDKPDREYYELNLKYLVIRIPRPRKGVKI